MSNYYADNSGPPMHPQSNDATKVVLIVLGSVAVIFFLACAGVFALGFVGFQAARQEAEAQRAQAAARRASIGQSSSFESVQYQVAVGSGDYRAALKAADKRIEAAPEDAWAHNNKAWLLCTCPVEEFRDGMLAIQHAEHACEITYYNNAMVLDTLAAAHAEIGDFGEAVRWQEKAIEKIASANIDVQGYHDRLKLFQSGQPYREGAVPPGYESTIRADSLDIVEETPDAGIPIDAGSDAGETASEPSQR